MTVPYIAMALAGAALIVAILVFIAIQVMEEHEVNLDHERRHH